MSKKVNEQKSVKHRLDWFEHTKNKTKNVSKTCRYFGISRFTYYYWLKKFKLKKIKGLEDASKRPINIRYKINAEITARIIKIRRHFKFGPGKISKYMAEQGIKISSKTIYKLLKSAKLNILK